MTDKKVEEPEVLVVKEIPAIQTKLIKDAEGKEYVCVTEEEALKEILETVRILKKQILS